MRRKLRNKALFVGAILTILAFGECGPKEKGKVKVTAFIYNRSGYTLLVSGPTVPGTDSIQNETEFSFTQEEFFRSKSKPLCCPCAGKVSEFTFTVADTTKTLLKDLNDATLWEKQTKVRIDYWICRLNIDTSDIVNK